MRARSSDYLLNEAASSSPRSTSPSANVFGGALLLPPWLVRKVWDEHRSVEAIAEAFDCSLSADARRWQQHYGFIGSS
jgi:hypothetical protein